MDFRLMNGLSKKLPDAKYWPVNSTVIVRTKSVWPTYF